MGTNFYLIGPIEVDGVVFELDDKDEDDPCVHIGKRSAAGWYCWDCKKTLQKGGEEQIHIGSPGPENWHPCCPECGSIATDDDSSVRSCSSFTWAMNPVDIIKLHKKEGPVIKDEYDRTYTFDKFIETLSWCPVQFYQSIGRWFC